MITTDAEKLWPWHSSDVTKEGMLTSAEAVLPDINCCCFFVLQKIINSNILHVL